jgi:hypothetical protein
MADTKRLDLYALRALGETATPGPLRADRAAGAAETAIVVEGADADRGRIALFRRHIDALQFVRLRNAARELIAELVELRAYRDRVEASRAPALAGADGARELERVREENLLLRQQLDDLGEHARGEHERHIARRTELYAIVEELHRECAQALALGLAECERLRAENERLGAQLREAFARGVASHEGAREELLGQLRAARAVIAALIDVACQLARAQAPGAPVDLPTAVARAQDLLAGLLANLGGGA